VHVGVARTRADRVLTERRSFDMLDTGFRLAQYEIISAIGSGGMGVVYRARDTRLGRDVALKVMAPHIASDPVMRRRFETEARSVAALTHPGILSIYELGIVEGTPFAVMELLEGRNLRDRIAAGAMPWREAVETAAAMADGLAAAHAKGIVHRDLKPENVFLTSDGHVKILDFGLALQRLEPTDSDTPTVALTAQGLVLGTFGYMSPEQVTGGRVDGRTDIFALGCLLYEMIAGRQLFSGATPQEVIAHLLHGGPPAMSNVDPLVPPELRAIITRAVERDPAKRFESTPDVAQALRALLSGSAVRLTRQPRPRGKSLAILPFVNAADPQLDYLTDGITESVINSLSQLPNVRVVPRSLVFRYKGLQADPAAIGMALNARTILTGRVTQVGDILHIQAEMVDTSTESQLWGEQFHHKLTEVMTVQEEIAWQISEALRLKLTAAQKKNLRKRATVSPDAYQAYLRGRHHWNNWSADSFRRAVDSFQQAIDLDPSYALAYAGLGDAYGAMAYYGYIDPRDGFFRARAAAERSLQLDPDLGDAHVTLALCQLFALWNWSSADRELQLALKQNPKLPLAHAVRALFLVTSGRFAEAMAEARIAKEQDPLSLFTNMGVAWVHHFAGEHEDAIREAQRARELVRDFYEAGNILIASYEALARFEEAIRLFREQTFWGLRFDADELLAALREGGPSAYWRKRLSLIQPPEGNVPPALLVASAVCYVKLGDYDRALDQVEQMVDAHVGGSVFIAVDPTLRGLRGNERFEALLRRVGTPMASAPHTAST
jgi:serine/threonine protein kinase/tetratricopeptide (TPR) repeat protein